MWYIEHSETTSASVEQLWAAYLDTDNGPQWDPMVKKIKLDGPFAVGSTGTNTPPFGPSVKFTMTEVTPLKSYTEISKAPGARLIFSHSIVSSSKNVTFTHGIACEGLLSGLYAVLLKKNYTRLLPVAMKNLARRIETSSEVTNSRG